MPNKATPPRKTAAKQRGPTLAELRARLAEAEETLDAIRSGDVDALVVTGPHGEQVFTLRGAEQPYRILVEEMNDGAAILTPEGTLLYANRRLATMLQTPLESLSGQAFTQFVGESERATFEALLAHGLKRASQGELSLQPAKGTPLSAHLSFNALTMNGAAAAGLIVSDLTQQKRNEEIVAAEKLARSILEQAAEAVVVIDENGRVIRASHGAQRLAGKNPMLQPFEFAFPLRLKQGGAPGKSGSDWFAVSSVLRGDALRSVEVTLVRENSTYDLLLSAGPLYNAQNEILGGVITLMDITEFERTQDQLRFQATVLENVRESVIVTDIQGRIVYWNEGASEVFGYSEAEMLGQSVSLLYPTQSDEELASALLGILDGRDYVGEWQGRHKNGATVWVDIKTTLLRDANGSILGFIGVAKDVTDRRHTRMALQARARQQAVVAQLGQEALAGMSLAQLMDEAVQRVAQTLDVEFASVLELLPDGDALKVRAAYGWQQGALDTRLVSSRGDESQAGYTLMSNAPVIVADYQNETRFRKAPQIDESQVLSGMSCIIGGSERPFGILGTHSRRRVEFSADDVHFLEAMANVLAAAIQRERAEDTLRTSEQSYRTVTETASDGILTIDDQSLILFANPAAERIFGYTRDELIGQPLTMLMPPEYRERHRQALSEYVRTGQRHLNWMNLELPGIHRSGERIELGLSFGDFKRDGRHVITGVVRDITARKAAERRLTTQYAVTRILAESATIEEAMPKVLQAVCENLGWHLGVMWQLDRDASILRPQHSWRVEGEGLQPFVSATCEGQRAKREGLPGQVWSERAPLWVPDYDQRSEYARAQLAAQYGLHTALAFPLAVGDEIVGIIECFNQRAQPLDDDLLQMLGALGSQIGQFVERKRAQEAMREQREYLQVTLSSIGDAVIATDIHGRITFMNEIAQSLTGWADDTAVGRPLDEVYTVVDEATHAPQRSRVEQIMDAVNTAKPHAASLLIARDGRELPIDDRVAPIRDGAGNSMGVVLVFRDISQRREAETAMARLAAIVESSHDAIIGLLTDGTIVSWNPGAERLYHFTADEMVGQPLTRMVPPARHGELIDVLERLQRGELVRTYETQRLRKDGTLVDVSVSSSPLQDSTGRIVGAATIARDISEAKRNERAQVFLAQASEILSSSLNIEQTLQSVANLVLPSMADFLIIFLGNTLGQVYHVMAAHADVSREELMRQIEDDVPDPEHPNAFVSRVLRSGKSELISEITNELIQNLCTDATMLAVYEQLGPRSALVVPLIARGITLGAIALLYAESGRRYDAIDLALAEQLGTRAALALDNASLYQAEIAARAEAEDAQQREAFLAEASSVLASSLDYETTLARVARLAVPLLADSCVVDLVDTDGAIRRVAVAHIHPDKEKLLGEIYQRYPHSLLESQTMIEVLSTGKSQLLSLASDAVLKAQAADETHLAMLRELANHSAMVVPLVGHGQILGTMTFGLTAPHQQYGSEELALAESLASRAALAIDNARLYQAEQHARRAAERAAERTAQLQAVTAALSEALTPAQVASTVVEHAMDALQARRALVLMSAREGQELELLSFAGYTPEQLGERRLIGADTENLFAQAVRTRQPVWVRSAQERERLYPAPRELEFLTDAEAWAAVPLVLEGRAIGVLGLGWSDARSFEDEDSDFMRALAQQCAQALERARLYDAEQRARAVAEAAHQRESFLAEASTLLASSLDYETTLTSVARLIVPQLADWCVVHVLDEDESLQQLALAHVNPEKVKWARELQERYPPDPDAARGVPQVLRSGQPEYLREVSDAALHRAARDPEHLRLLRELGIRSFMIVPLIASGKPIGALTFVTAESNRHYEPEDVTFAEAVAGRAALAVENARLLRHTQRLNAELEQRVIVRTTELRAANVSLQNEIHERTRAEATVRSLLRISERLNSALDLDTLLDVLAQEAIRLVDAEGGCVGLREGDEMVVRNCIERNTHVEHDYRWARGQGLPGWVLEHKSPYIANEPASDPQVRLDLPINQNARSVICTPIVDVQGEVIGFFNIQNKMGDGKFTRADDDLLLAISQTAAIAIQNALAYQKIQQGEERLRFSNEQLRRLSGHLQSAREEERMSVAREIHDELGQVLTALKMDLSMLGRRFSEGSAEVQRTAVLQDIKMMGTLIDNTIQSVREIITELRPEMLEDLGLKAAMEWQVQEFQTRTGIQCSFDQPSDDIHLDYERSVALFRILQESLTNVARHARATQVDIQLAKDDGHLILRIHDNGRGIRVNEMNKAKSFGLLGMRERTVLLGGELTIDGEPGLGTTITVRVPTLEDEQT